MNTLKTTMMDRMQKASMRIFEQSLKIYHLKDIISHKKSHPHSLVQNLSFFPNHGLGFYIWRISWPKNMYIRITSVNFKSHRNGMFRGMKYFGGKTLTKMPQRINGTSKRGTWKFDIGQARAVRLDNGLVYTPNDFKVYMNFRKSWGKPIVKTSEQPLAEGQQPPAEGQQAVAEGQQAVTEGQQPPVEGQQAVAQGQQVAERQTPTTGQQVAEVQQQTQQGQQAPQQAPVQAQQPATQGQQATTANQQKAEENKSQKQK